MRSLFAASCCVKQPWPPTATLASTLPPPQTNRERPINPIKVTVLELLQNRNLIVNQWRTETEEYGISTAGAEGLTDCKSMGSLFDTSNDLVMRKQTTNIQLYPTGRK